MLVKIQFNDGEILDVDHYDFYQAIRERDCGIFRFSIGNADFYNHDYYALIIGDRTLHVVEWNVDKHACVYEIISPKKWRRIQYGSGSDPENTLPKSKFKIPPRDLIIKGILIPDNQAQDLLTQWPITKLDDYSKQGF